jgi:hypothetical protein
MNTPENILPFLRSPEVCDREFVGLKRRAKNIESIEK